MRPAHPNKLMPATLVSMHGGLRLVVGVRGWHERRIREGISPARAQEEMAGVVCQGLAAQVGPARMRVQEEAGSRCRVAAMHAKTRARRAGASRLGRDNENNAP